MAAEGNLKKALTVENFNVDPSELNAEKEYEFWKTKFEISVTNLKANNQQKLQIMTNKLNSEVYEYTDGLADYGEAIQKLHSVFKKKPNILFTRYKLSTSNQNSGETIKAYVVRLSLIAKACVFKYVTAKKY